MLGDLLTSLTDESMAVETILNAGDLNLFAAVREHAAAAELDLGSYITQSVQRYASEASDEEWLTLMGLLNRSQNPGAICLQRALGHALRG